MNVIGNVSEQDDNLIDVVLPDDALEEPKVTVAQEPIVKKDINFPHQNVEIAQEAIKEAQKPHEDGDYISLPSDTFQAVEDVVSNAPSVEVGDSDEWVANIQDALSTEIYNGTGYPRFAQEGGLFTNLVKNEQNVKLNGSYALSLAKENSAVTGERAVLSIMNYMKIGNVFVAPLWNSGFWVSVKPPTESAVIDLMHIIRSDKVRIGRATYGLSLSSTTGIVAKHVVSFIKEHIYSTSINPKEFDISNIEKYIHLNDLDALILAIVSSMYPDGFNFNRSCVADPLTCNHVSSGIVAPDKIHYVNRRIITEQMMGHMSNRKGSNMSLKDVETYQKQLASRNSRTMVYERDGRKIEFDLKTPTLDRYIESTDMWVSEIENIADKLLSKDSDDRDRQIMINNHAKATTMRQYSHYVEAIRYGNNNVIMDFPSITRVLNTLSSDDDLSRDFNKNITELINRSTIAATGIPTFDCPNCKKPVYSRKDEDTDYANLIPLDLLSIFFDLVRVKMGKIAQR